MSAEEKFQGLYGISDGPEIFETEDPPEIQDNAELNTSLKNDYDDEDQDEDIISRSVAESLKQSKFLGQHTLESEQSLYYLDQTRSLNVIRGATRLSESRGDKLLRLRKEIDELKAEIEEDSHQVCDEDRNSIKNLENEIKLLQSKYNKSKGLDPELLRKLLSSTQDLTKDHTSQNDSIDNPGLQHNYDSKQLYRLGNLEERISKIEQLKAAVSPSIMHKWELLSNKVDLLAENSSVVEHAINQLKKYADDLEYLQTVFIKTESRQIRESEILQKILFVYSKVSTIQLLQENVDLLLHRLKSLQYIHSSAADAIDNCNKIGTQISKVQADVAEWKGHIDSISDMAANS